MISFKDFLYEASIDDFMSKINNCQTLEGLGELEKYYKKRAKEAELKDTDDIQVRDALAGRKDALAAEEPEEEDDF